MDLSVILKSVIPDNIRNIPLVSVCTDAFSEMLSRDCNVSIRIRDLFDTDSSVFYRRDESGVLVPEKTADEILDEINKEKIKDNPDKTKIKTLTEYLEYREYTDKCRNSLKKGLFYTYFAVMFELIGNLCRNSTVIGLVKARQLTESKLLNDEYDTVNSEYLGAFRYFQQCSGTESAIRYIYQFSRYLETGSVDNTLELESGDPFFLGYNGELHKSVFSEFNMPLAHPCGWCLFYNTVVKQYLTDYYGIKHRYNISTVTLKWRSKTIYIGELPEGVETDNILFERAIFTLEEKLLNSEVAHIISNRTPRPDGQYIHVVNLVVTNYSEDGDEVVITFDSGKALYVNKKGYTVRYGDVSSVYNPDAGYTFPKNTRLALDAVDSEYEILYKDQMLIEEAMELSGSDKYYYTDNYSNAFKLAGSEYPYCPGIDESRHKVTNSPNLMEKFTCTINYRSSNITYLKIEDDFGHSYAVTRDQPCTLKAQNQFKVNTHGYRGEFLTFHAYDGLSYNYDHYIRTNLLNKTSVSVRVSEFSIENNRLRFKVQGSGSSLYTVIRIQSDVIERRTGPITTIDIDTSAYPLYSGYSISIEDNTDEVTIEGNGLNNTAYNFYFSFPEYPSKTVIKPVFVTCTPDTMSPVPKGKTLGELNETPALTYRNGIITEDPRLKRPDGAICVSELEPSNHKGAVFVNRGYTKAKTKGLDVLNTSCTKYMTDEFYCETSGSNTWLEFDNSFSDGSLGKYLICRFNNDPQTDVTRGFLRGNILVFR